MKFIFLILFTILLSLTACTEDLTSEQRYNEDLYFISGVLYEGEPITIENAIRVGKTANVNEEIDLKQMMIDAEVVITDMENDQKYTLSPVPLSNFVFLGYYDSTGTLIPEGGKTYQIKVTVGTQEITARTTVPYKINPVASSIFTNNPQGTIPEVQYDLFGDQNPIIFEIEKLLEGQNNLRIHCITYCLEEWDEVTYTEPYQFGGHETPEESDEYESPQNGEPRKIEYIYEAIPNNENKIKDYTYNTTIVFYGNYEFTIQSVDENFYSYFYKNESYRQSGINNGIGYFGSASRLKLYTKVIE